MSGGNFVLRLDVIKGDSVAYSEIIDQEKAKIGTLGSATLRLDDHGVSTIHALVERVGPESFMLTDLGSAAGTFVNGSRIQRHVLNHGDQVHFGNALVIAQLIEPQVSHQPAVAQNVAAMPNQVRLADGTVVVPYGDSGYYDEAGNYIPGYYDEYGEYHLGYGYLDEFGHWQVVFGYYDTQGDWVDTDEPVSAVPTGERSTWRFDGISDKRVYTESYFSNQGGDTIEIAMIWQDAVLSVSDYKPGELITLSADPDSKAHYILSDPSLTQDPFPLVDTTGTPNIFVSQSMRTLICKNGQEFSLEQALAQGYARPHGSLIAIPFDSQTSASIDIGEVTFVIHYTRIPAVVLVGPSFDYGQLGYFAASFGLHVLILLLILMVPSSSDTLNLDSFGVDNRFAELLVQPEEEVPPDEPDYLDKDGEEDGAQQASASDSSDSSGGPSSDDAVDDMELPPNATAEQIEQRRAHNTKVALDSGIAQLFNDGGAFGGGGFLGGGGGAVGDSANMAIGAITDGGGSAAAGEARDFGGLSLSSGGRGTVGAGEKGFGSAGVATAGRGGGGAAGKNYGKKAANLGERNTRVPQIVPGNPTVHGSLDREIIKRVIRQHRNEIKFCYESELQKNKSLAGRVTVSFTIAASGSVIVARIADSTLKSPKVENCITQKIRRWVFPEPKGGGMARVNYPFNFSN